MPLNPSTAQVPTTGLVPEWDEIITFTNNWVFTLDIATYGVTLESQSYGSTLEAPAHTTSLEVVADYATILEAELLLEVD